MNLCGYVGRYVDMYVGRKVCLRKERERGRVVYVCTYSLSFCLYVCENNVTEPKEHFKHIQFFGDCL